MYVLLTALLAVIITFSASGCGGGGGGGVAKTPGGGTVIDGTNPPGAPASDGDLKQWTTLSSFSIPLVVGGSACDSVWVTINGTTERKITGNTAAKVSVTLSLQNGVNDFSITCRNKSNKESAAYTDYVIRDSVSPTVNISSALLTDGASIRTADFDIERSDFLLVNYGGVEYQLKNTDTFNKNDYGEIVRYPLSFPLSTGSNNISFRTRDYAGNFSQPLTRTLNGATITNTAPRLGSSGIVISPSSGKLSTTFNFTNTCSANCVGVTYSVNYGDGATAGTATSSHTYAAANIYPVSVTLTGTAGTNTYTKVLIVRPEDGTVCVENYYCQPGENKDSCPHDCGTNGNTGGGDGGGGNTCDNDGTCDPGESNSSCPNDCGSGTGNYSLQNTFTIPDGSVDMTAYNGNLLATYGDGSVKQFGTGGGQTNYTMSGAPAFGTPVSGSACINSGRFVIADQTKGTTGQIDVFTIDTVNNVLTFAFTFGYNNSETDGKVDRPNDVYCDATGNFWVRDNGNSAIKKFNSSGTFVCKYIGATHLGVDIAGDNAGNIYVTNQGTDRVDVIDSSCSFLKVIGSGTATSNSLDNPGQLIVDPGGATMAVADEGHHRITFYNPSLRTDLGYVGYSTTAAAPKGAAVIAGVFYILRNSVVEPYQSSN